VPDALGGGPSPSSFTDWVSERTGRQRRALHQPAPSGATRVRLRFLLDDRHTTLRSAMA